MDETRYDLTSEEGAETVRDVVERIEEAAVVDRRVLQAVIAAVLARGHVLLEDVPGTGKTVTARVLAEALGLEFTRIQFTPDLLPGDVTGSTVYDEHDGSFEFVEGPVFSNVVLADEINRAPPKTQAALLEAMEERQVSADGETYDLPEPFLVVATQNPVEQEGTFRLPEAQRDRFSVKTSLGYPDVDGEMELLEKRANRRSLAPSVDPITTPEVVSDLQELAEDVTVEDRVRRYIIELARETRRDPRTEIGVSPRGVQRVFEAARAGAVIGGRDYVTPEDVKRLAEPTMAHRLVLTTEANVEGVDPRDVVRDALEAIEVPAVSPDAPGEADAPEDEPLPGDATGDRRAAEPEANGGQSGEATSGRPSEATGGRDRTSRGEATRRRTAEERRQTGGRSDADEGHESDDRRDGESRDDADDDEDDGGSRTPSGGLDY